MARKMNLRQRRFCHAYLMNGGDAKKAIIEAGYNPNPLYAKQLAYNTLQRAPVKLYINRAIEKMEKDFGITFNWKLLKLKRIINFYVPEDESMPVLDGSVGVKALSELNKMQGDYAPTKTDNTNANLNTDVEIADMQELIKQHQRDY